MTPERVEFVGKLFDPCGNIPQFGPALELVAHAQELQALLLELADHFASEPGPAKTASHYQMQRRVFAMQAKIKPYRPALIRKSSIGAAVDIAAFIRDQAARGHSRASVRETLGYSRECFDAALALIGPINWPGPGEAMDYLRAMEARRGVATPAGLKALENARAARKELHSHTVRDKRGTVAELCAYFKVPLTRKPSAGGLLKVSQSRPRFLTPFRRLGPAMAAAGL